MFKVVLNFIKSYKNVAATYRGMPIDDGCFLQQVGRDEYKYWEGEKAMLIQIDMLCGQTEKAIYPNVIKRWLPPHDEEEISEEKKKEIISKICKHFDSVKMMYKVVE